MIQIFDHLHPVPHKLLFSVDDLGEKEYTADKILIVLIIFSVEDVLTYYYLRKSMQVAQQYCELLT